ncbi:hypothetical protein [Sphingomonas daechungensis]|uniref:hypothetical protein n=1 Tax=Sphingomonas daechungensis TaxID=1176646 RepID=UPI003784708F
MNDAQIRKMLDELEGDNRMLRAQLSAVMLTAEVSLSIISAILPRQLGDAALQQLAELGTNTSRLPTDLSEHEAVAASDMAIRTAETVREIVDRCSTRRAEIAATLDRLSQQG